LIDLCSSAVIAAMLGLLSARRKVFAGLLWIDPWLALHSGHGMWV
jgi:hypothetical protein